MSTLEAIPWILGAYLLGALSFAYFFVKWRKGVDLRTLHSGNLGATNASRVLGRRFGIAIYVLDMGKGLAPVLVARGALRDHLVLGGAVPLSLLVGAAAFAGHCWPIYYGFRGGKGVATASGVVLALAPIPALCGFAAFVVCVAASRMVSLGSMAAAIVLPIAFVIFEREFGGAGDAHGRAILIFLVALSAVVIFRHRANIGRIARGEEPKIGRKHP